jgi:5-methylcytosine-specific restriction protein B
MGENGAMARIREFYQTTKASKAHPTEVECGYQIVGDHGEVLLQLSTYGSDDRASEKKTSQTIQIDRQRATELVQILMQSFPGLAEEIS